MSGSTATRLHFYTDPATFLLAAGDHLGADPVTSTVVTTAAHRSATRVAQGIAQPTRNWWLTVHDESGMVRGAAMRTAPFAPYPLFLLPMPDEAAVALARALSERGEEVRAINGALPTVQRCAAELVRLSSGRVEVAQHTRLHELGDLRWPASAPGGLVSATKSDLDLATEWFIAFHGDADLQAGRPRRAHASEDPDRSDILHLIESGQLWFWLDDAGRRVHLTGVHGPAFGVARVGPVYTPPAERGRGWASNAVAEVSRRLQAQGARVCLFTDQANPTSNKIYAALGYRPVVDMANLSIHA
jgi:hypothetical protein